MLLKIPIENSTALADVWFDQIYQKLKMGRCKNHRDVDRVMRWSVNALVVVGLLWCLDINKVASIITKHCTVAAWPLRNASFNAHETGICFSDAVKSSATLSYLKCKQENNEIRSIGLEGDQQSKGGYLIIICIHGRTQIVYSISRQNCSNICTQPKNMALKKMGCDYFWQWNICPNGELAEYCFFLPCSVRLVCPPDKTWRRNISIRVDFCGRTVHRLGELRLTPGPTMTQKWCVIFCLFEGFDLIARLMY